MKLWKAALVLAGVLAVASCSTPKMATADEQLARGEYFNAAATYRKVYNRLKKRSDRQMRGEAAFKMAGCYEKLNMASRAAAAYRSAARYDYPDSSLYLGLGRTLQAEGRYKEAIEANADYLKYRPEDPQGYGRPEDQVFGETRHRTQLSPRRFLADVRARGV